MKTRILALVAAITLALFTPIAPPWSAPVGLFAQTAVSTTTFGAAVAATDTTITLASTTGITAGSASAGASFLFARDGSEQMRVIRVISATQVQVQRALAGLAGAYASGGTVYYGTGDVFKATGPPAGNCTASAWAYTPWINLVNGGLSTCVNSQVSTSIPGNLLSRNAQGLGYAGGCAVTQATSKSTGATCTGATGEVTMNGAALGADTAVSFALTNTSIAAGDYVLCQHVSGGTAGAYGCTAVAAAGSATVTIKNNTAGALSEAAVVKFVLIKAATS